MAEKFRAIAAKGFTNKWTVLSINDSHDYAAQDIYELLNECDLGDGIKVVNGKDYLPSLPGVYLLDFEEFVDESVTSSDPSHLYYKLKSVTPLLTKDIPLYKSGHMRVSLDPSETPILTDKEIIELAKDVLAEHAADEDGYPCDTLEKYQQLYEEAQDEIKT